MKSSSYSHGRLATDIEHLLAHDDLEAAKSSVPEIRCETILVAMRDGVRLATDVYRSSISPAPTIAMRTPYGRANDKLIGAFISFVRRGYVVVSQDCRGTGQSEPDSWDYYMHETEDGIDFVEWVTSQEWFDGFLGACGGSYVGQTQWCMALHSKMSTIVPEVSGLGIASNTAHMYMALSAYAKSIGKGSGTVALRHMQVERLLWDETLAGGHFNERLYEPVPAKLLETYPEMVTLSPIETQRWLWAKYASLQSAERAKFIKAAFGVERVTALEVERCSAIFGIRISHDAHTIPHPSPPQLCRSIQAPVLLHTGWYDWGLNDALATWSLLRSEGKEHVRSRSRLIVAPSAHNVPGYHEGMGHHPELRHNHRTASHVGLLLRWYAAIRENEVDSWPVVTYYLMGANEWRRSPEWPPPDTREIALHLGRHGSLSTRLPMEVDDFAEYTYNPEDPTPTVGGSIVSSVCPAGSVDVSQVQLRSDVLVYTTPPLDHDLDVVGPLTLVLYASSSAVDTDFCARLSDVFPDGRAIQLQSGILRARYRNSEGPPEFLEPSRVYKLTIDLWATANRFKAGHCLRVDISSADFPRFDRNSNLGGRAGLPVPARQTIYHDVERPSHLRCSILDSAWF